MTIRPLTYGQRIHQRTLHSPEDATLFVAFRFRNGTFRRYGLGGDNAYVIWDGSVIEDYETTASLYPGEYGDKQ